MRFSDPQSVLYLESFRYKQFISVHTLDELLTPEARAAENAANNSSAVASSDAENTDMKSEGSSESKDSTKPALTEEEEFAKFNQARDEMYKIAKEQDSRIVEYESAIRRPYFHVKPLDDAQLTNWHRYLDFIEKEGDFSKVTFLHVLLYIASMKFWINIDKYYSMPYNRS